MKLIDHPGAHIPGQIGIGIIGNNKISLSIFQKSGTFDGGLQFTIKKLINRKKMVSAAVLAGLLISVSVTSLAAEGQAYQGKDSTADNQLSGPAGPGMEEVPGRFALPEGARVLVIVEGTGGSG